MTAVALLVSTDLNNSSAMRHRIELGHFDFGDVLTPEFDIENQTDKAIYSTLRRLCGL